MALRAQQHAGIMLERFRRLPPHLNPSSLTASVAQPTRISWGGQKGPDEADGLRGCWRSAARQVSAEAGTLHTTPEQLLIAPIRAPWESTAQPVIQPELKQSVSRAKNTPAERQQAALETIAQLPAADLYLSTDGSAKNGIRKGGAGWFGVALREGLKALYRALASPGARTPHLQLALECLGAGTCLASTMGLSVTAFSDSQGLLKRLSSGPIAQRGRVESEIWDIIEVLWSECKVKLVLQFVPSHTLDDEDFDAANPLSGNRVADRAAERGSARSQRGRPVDFRSAASVVKRHVREQWAEQRPDHWHRDCTGGVVPTRHPQRRVERVLANLRTGHCAKLQAYRARFCGEESD
eukprot:gene3504-8609_t